jgi:predicted nucleic acid-binding protein
MNREMDGVSKLYVDANILIYFIEGNAEFQAMVARVFAEADARGAVLVTSEMSIAECLHGPFKRGDAPLVETYRAFFKDEELIALAPIVVPVLDLAAQVGADLGLKTVDAIHVASAMSAGCDALLTNDRGMRATEPLAIRQLSQWR